MHIDIQARSFSLTEALRAHTRRRLGFAFDRRDLNIQRVAVRLSDINGPRGGEDKQCRIQVVLPHMPDVVIEDIDCDMYASIDRAVDRAGNAVARKLARQRDKQRSAPLIHEYPSEEDVVLN